ncbi:MAG: tetratricopeptide repeat protein [Polyangiales bacterium]|jgi:TolA-binding protein
MGMFRSFDGQPQALCTRLGLVSLLALAAPGCISQMQADIAANQKRLDSLEADLEAKRKELEEALAEASRVLRRNSADQGLQIEELQQRLAVLEGEIAELRNESTGSSQAQMQRSLELERQLSEVARAAGMDVPLEASEIPQSKSAHWDALSKAYRINKFSYARGLARVYVERYPKDDRADDAQYIIGSTYLKQGQPAAALGEFKKVLSSYRKGDAIDKTLYEMAQAFLQVRACNDAATALKALLKNHKKSPLVPEAKKELRKVGSLGRAECEDR